MKQKFAVVKMENEKTKTTSLKFSDIGIYVLVLVMAAMVLMVFINAVARYGFSISFPVTEELARYGFVWVSFLGAIMAFLRGGHVGVDLLISHVKGISRLGVRLLGEVVIWLVIIVIARGGWAYFTQTYLNESQGTGLPFGVISVAPLVLVVVMIVTEIKRIREYIKEWKNDRSTRSGEVK